METNPGSTALAGSSNDAPASVAYEDGPFSTLFTPTAVTTAAVTGGQFPRPTNALPSLHPAEAIMRDTKSMGARIPEDGHDVADHPNPRLRSSRTSQWKDKESLSAGRETKKPLRLLDLPVDILKDIVKEVTHTNDLTSLALTHSALHRLTTPHIYSRFDIVWPDSSTHAEPRSGVDALTYGLATLVMGEEIFGEAPNQMKYRANRFNARGHGLASETTVRRRRGNHYAQFTRKFSLGNGPADWVQEYLISKEGGKMLGTLVALAVARMRTLETFIWDMPTGILRDVWLALSSLGDRDDDQPCRLERLWVRWHDNSSIEAFNAGLPPPPPLSIPAVLPPHLHSANFPSTASSLNRVERPTFSVLSPLKSLSVLDIDELAYLDEMAVLVGRSIDRLRELRVGIAKHATTRNWARIWEGDDVQQVDRAYPTAGCLSIGEKRLGGVLGILTGFVHNMRDPKTSLPDRTKRKRPLFGTNPNTDSRDPPSSSVQINAPSADDIDASDSLVILSTLEVISQDIRDEPTSTTALPDTMSIGVEPSVEEPTSPFTPDLVEGRTGISRNPSPLLPNDSKQISIDLGETSSTAPNDVLRLENLELERVPLSVPVLQNAFDWTRLTSLTLLHCPNHEQLWKTLRRAFAPQPKSPTYPHARWTPSNSPRKANRASQSASEPELQYALRLKKVHTNTVSPALISFLKETLAPNTLEILFLQETRAYLSPVAIETIFKGPLRRHRGSLRKVLIDSSEKNPDGQPSGSSRWRRWLMNREILNFVCSGKMPLLRELGMVVDYRDWHFFLQRLPFIPHLRSLYIPYLADHVHGANADPRDLALQVVDIVALRPEIELCYLGIASKCFEILENRHDCADSRPVSRPTSQLGGAFLPTNAVGTIVGGPPVTGSEDEDDDDQDADDAAEDDDDVEEPVVVVEEDDTTESEIEESGDVDDEDDEDVDDNDDTDSEFDGSDNGKSTAARLRLREILFYDDKVAIFKARHGRL